MGLPDLSRRIRSFWEPRTGTDGAGNEEHASGHPDLSGIELFDLSSVDEILKAESQNTLFHPSEVELSQTADLILREITRIQPTRVVFDSLSEMRMLTDTPLRYRRQILQLKQFFAGRNCTVLLLDDRTSGTNDLQVESIAFMPVASTTTFA